MEPTAARPLLSQFYEKISSTKSPIELDVYKQNYLARCETEEERKTIEDLYEHILESIVQEQFSDPEEDEYPFLMDNKIIPYLMAKYLAEKHNILSDAQSMYVYRGGIYEDIKPNLYQFIDGIVADKRLIKMSLVNEVTSQVRCSTYQDEVSQTRGYIHFKNGLYDVKKRDFIKDDSKVISFGKMNYNYDKDKGDIGGTDFEKFIETSLGKEYLPVVQELIAVSLYPITDKTAYFYILYGQGRNGKGLLMKIIDSIVPGTLKSNIGISGYDTRFLNASIKGKTLNISFDDNTNRLEEIGNLKTVTAGEPILVEKKGLDAMTIQPILTHISAFNKLPSMNEKANAFFDRLIAIEFKNTFGTSEEVERGEKDFVGDKDLLDKILASEMEQIISWAMEGLFRLLDNGYKFTKINEMLEASNKYRLKIDSVMEWANAELVPLETFTNADMTKGIELYKRYLRWCDEEIISRPTTRNAFYESMQRIFKGRYKTISRQLYFAVLNNWV